MKIRIQLILLFTFFYFSLIKVYSQEYTNTLRSTELQLKGANDKIPDNIIIKVNQDESGFTHVIIEDGVNELTKFLIKPFSLELFKAKMKFNVFKTLQQNSAVLNFKDDENDPLLTKLYSEINSYFNTVNERPEVATVKLKSDAVRVYADILHEKTQGNKKKEFGVHIGELEQPELVMTFYSGFIEKIEIHGKFNGHDIKLSNKYSIGVSSQKNIKTFNRIRLFSKYPYDIEMKRLSDATPYNERENESYNDIKDGAYRIAVNREKRSYDTDGYEIVEGSSLEYVYLYLNEIISYERYLDVNANDISPTKQRIILDQQQKSSKLYREESTKIIEAVVYSDLLAAFDENNPSGVLQTEVKKKFNIKTSRLGKFGGGAGMFEYLDVRILLSKIEEDNKFLKPTNGEFGLLDFFNHRNFSVGGLLNWISYENQDLKLNAFYDSGVEFSRSGYKLNDTAEENNLNAMQWSHQLKIHIFPEKRYGVVFKNKLFYYEVLDNNEEFIGLLNKKKDWYNTIELAAYLDIATSAKVFVRYGLVHELSNLNNNFSRFQIGTAFFLLQKNRKDIVN